MNYLLKSILDLVTSAFIAIFCLPILYSMGAIQMLYHKKEVERKGGQTTVPLCSSEAFQLPEWDAYCSTHFENR